ncbi:aminopeptidase P N-terminal domain-containing protein [Quatrionicoccus australiensis]|uniref:aminopeptidase P N-terminal domain-containing protein n=1 Tax=Quatrionicoccus australiensis TaxID=138118 RepID=UPI001CFC0AE2|nr:aminopeptidase P N-terminal domain-containing protein [Quatrionicoccus australiensis]MCB4360607.1 aminopeptidase P N-terminal domain-containing protein [Quatrionicoccus australiensis]
MSHAHFIARRKRLLKTIGDGVAIIPTAPEVVRNRDAHHPFRFDSYFWYLSGFPEPEAVVVLVGGRRPKSILFCREKHAEREIWDGYRYGPKAAKAAFGFDAAYPIELLDQKLPEFLVDRDTLWHAVGHDDAWDARIARALNAVRAESRAGKRAPRAIHDLRFELDAMRLIKDAAEADIQQRSADIASAGHARAMRACQPGMAEYELEAELTYEFRKRGADAHAYTPIVAGGANACVLHYVENNKILNDNTLVLIDAGCEVAGYAADITRTFPVNGRFNAAQKDVYEIVLAAQDAAFAATAPGRHFMEGHDAAVRVLTQGLIDLKLLAGDLDNLIEKSDYKRFYMHRTGHWLGLDVHDAGEYKVGDAWTSLQPGMTLTVEPGLYIRPGADIPPALAGIGIRIEDDVRVTEAGCHVFTTAPKTVAEIEEVMRHD